MTVDSARGADINDLSTLIFGEASRLAAREFFDWANKQQVRYEVSLVSEYTTLTLCLGHDCYLCAFRSYKERRKVSALWWKAVSYQIIDKKRKIAAGGMIDQKRSISADDLYNRAVARQITYFRHQRDAVVEFFYLPFFMP